MPPQRRCRRNAIILQRPFCPETVARCAPRRSTFCSFASVMNASSFGLRQMIDQEPGKGGVPTAAGLEDHIGIWHGTNIKQVAGKRFVAWCFRQGTEIGDAGPEEIGQ